MKSKITVLAAAAVAAVQVSAATTEQQEKEPGYTIGEKLTLLPYVNVSYTFDSNVDRARHSSKGGYFLINPGLDIKYNDKKGTTLNTRFFYSHSFYTKYNGALKHDNFGESIDFSKTTPGAKEGWTLTLSQRYHQINSRDSWTLEDGRGVWRDREQLNFAGNLQRRFSQKFHASILGQYDFLDYRRTNNDFANLYGWQRWSVGGQVGHYIGLMSDFLLAGTYSHFQQKGSKVGSIRNDSDAWTVHVGLGSTAPVGDNTDANARKLTYRATVGASGVKYGRSRSSKSFTYSLSASYKITDRLNFAASGNSYYHPSETTKGACQKTYAISAGFGYKFTDKFTGTIDGAYRYTDRTCSVGPAMDNYHLWSGRLGVNYSLCRWISVYARTEFQDGNSYYNHSRYRGTIGMRFQY